MAKLPPQPIGVAPGHSYWNDWYEKLRTFVETITTSVAWSIITGTPTTVAGYGITDAAITDAVMSGSRLVVGNGTNHITVLGTLGTTTQVLHGNAAGLPTWGAVSLTADVSGVLPAANGGSSGANPSASVGLTATNGSATTYMRSDGAPSLSQSISPTWSGTHTFSNAITAASYIPTSGTAPTNGMYLYTTNAVGWSVNSVASLFLSAAGNLGVGIAPVAGVKLQVKAASDQNITCLSTNSAATVAGLTDAGSGAPLWVAGKPLTLSGNAATTAHLTINNSATADVTVSVGNLIVATAGKGLQVKEGTNAKMGTSALVGGTVTVNTTAVTANSRIFLTSQVDGGTPGFLRVTARTAATSFTITSSNAADTSTVAWLLFEPS